MHPRAMETTLWPCNLKAIAPLVAALMWNLASMKWLILALGLTSAELGFAVTFEVPLVVRYSAIDG